MTAGIIEMAKNESIAFAPIDAKKIKALAMISTLPATLHLNRAMYPISSNKWKNWTTKTENGGRCPASLNHSVRCSIKKAPHKKKSSIAVIRPIHENILI